MEAATSVFSDYKMVIDNKKLLDLTVTGILSNNYCMIHLFGRELSLNGRSGSYKNIILKIRVNGGRSEKVKDAFQKLQSEIEEIKTLVIN